MKREELEALVEKMTPGPWEVRQGGNFTDFGAPGFLEYCDEHSDSATDLKVGSTNVRLGNELLERSRTDAAAIVALRNEATRLLAIWKAAEDVGALYWGKDVTVEAANSRIDKMDALRAALKEPK